MDCKSHSHVGGCSCCSMSRRGFLATSAIAMTVPLVGAIAKESEGKLGDYVELDSLRPRPKVRIMSAVVRQKPPYWLGWPGTSYDLEGKREEFSTIFKGYAKELGVTFEEEANPLESEEAVDAYVKKIQSEKPEAVLVHLQHLSYWKWVDAVAKSGIPTIVWAPIGMAFTQHVKEISRRDGVHVISSLETSAVKQAMRMVRAKKQFDETRLLVLRGDERKEVVLDHLGTKVRHIPRSSLHELFAKMPTTDETHEVAKHMIDNAKKVVEPSEEDVLNAARSYQTAKHLMQMEESNAITSDCLGMVTQREVPTPPCMAACMFQDAGVTYGCEADIDGAFSLMLTSYLFDKPGFMNDPVPETVKNQLIVAHCVSGAKLNGFDQPYEPYILRDHSESALGVSLQVLWKVGQPVTLARFQGPKEMIVDTGTVVGNVDTPPAGGCRTSVEVEMDRVEDSRDVLGFHQVVFYGDHRRDLNAFCQMYGIKVINSDKEAAA